MVTLVEPELEGGDMDVSGLHADWAEEDIDLMVAELIGKDKVAEDNEAPMKMGIFGGELPASESDPAPVIESDSSSTSEEEIEYGKMN